MLLSRYAPVHNLWTAVIAARETRSTSHRMHGSLSSCGMGPDPGERLSWPAADRLEPGSGLCDLPTEDASMATVPATDESEVGGVGIFTTCPWRDRMLTVPRRVPSVTGQLPSSPELDEFPHGLGVSRSRSSWSPTTRQCAGPGGPATPRRRRDGRAARPPLSTDSVGGQAPRCGVDQ